MMKPIQFILASLTVVFSVISCERLEYVGEGGELVVEGWVMEGEFPIVIVSQSIPSQEDEIGISELTKYFRPYAVVKFSDGEQEITLVGKKDKAFTPQYIYTTSEIRGEAGKTYRISVSSDGQTVSASSKIEKNVPFAEVNTILLSGGRYSITASFVNDVKDSLDYKCFVWREDYDSYWVPSLLGTIDGRENGKITFDVKPSISLSSIDYQDTYSPGETVHIRLCSMKRPMYEYWKAFENMQNFSRNPLIPVYANLPSSFNGAIGYWTGYGHRDTTIIIPSK